MTVLIRDHRLLTVRATLTGAELVTNGGFETFTGTVDDGTTDSFTGWTDSTVGSNATREATATARSGSYALKFVTSAAQAIVFLQDLTVVAGASYVLRFFCRGDGVRAPRYSVYDQDNAAYIVAVTDTAVTGTAYQQIIKEFDAPAGCTTARLQFYNANTATAHTVYVDDVTCRRNYKT